MKSKLFTIVLFNLITFQVIAQWSNRYPKVEGYSHHIYLEAFELPILTSGPMDSAPSPVSNDILFASKGWLWILNSETKEAKRITSSAGIDSRPEWSPDGTQLVFIRDDSNDTQIVLLDLTNNKEIILVDENAIDLDPIFSPNGNLVYYSSSANGKIDLWQIDMTSKEKKKISTHDEIERRPVPHPDGEQLLYLEKHRSSYDAVKVMDLKSGTSKVLIEDRVASQSDIALSPDGFYMVYTWPNEGDYELRVLDIATPNTSVLLTQSKGMPLAPSFSADGQWIYFSEANDNERMTLKRISISGGETEDIVIKKWNWNAPTGTLKIKSFVDGKSEAVRMNIIDSNGHPVVPENGAIRFDGQNGRVFFYSNGDIEINGVAGDVTISAVHGFSTIEVTKKVSILPDTTNETTINLKRLWNPSANGWYSGDNHFHVNYGGVYRIDPKDIILDINGEDLDVATPLLANLHNRFLQQGLWGWQKDESPIISFGQETRSHFLGHLGLIGVKDLFWPWIWGPYYQVYSRDDRTNAEVLKHTRAQGGLGSYVHPISIKDPFTEGNEDRVPISFVADAVLGEVDLIEVACLWSDEIGSESLWHSVLNIGVPLAVSGGSDVMSDYYRTMAVGSARVFVKPERNLNMDSYIEALKSGKSFVTNGPLLEFYTNEKGPGEIIDTDSRKVKWTLNVHSALPLDKIEIIVNGKVVWSKEGFIEQGSNSYKGTVVVPPGGWITAKAFGNKTKWPSMDSYLFAESSPIWFNHIGSTDPMVAKQSAKGLLRVLNISEDDLKSGYGETPIPNLLSHFAKARKKLEAIINK